MNIHQQQKGNFSRRLVLAALLSTNACNSTQPKETSREIVNLKNIETSVGTNDVNRDGIEDLVVYISERRFSEFKEGIGITSYTRPLACRVHLGKSKHGSIEYANEATYCTDYAKPPPKQKE